MGGGGGGVVKQMMQGMVRGAVTANLAFDYHIRVL